MRSLEKGVVSFPGIDGGKWVQGRISTADCMGLVTLVDFWDYSSLSCLRTLPYVKEWHERYAHLGLLVVGVHTPQFEFGRDPRNVLRGVQGFDVPYTVVLDPDRRIWDAFANHHWPAKYLFDAAGYLRYHHSGEGRYADFELGVQALLRERNGGGEFQGVMEPVRESDRPGAVSPTSTQELHLGLRRGRIGNATAALPPDAAHDFPMPENLDSETVYLAGRWRSHPERCRYMGEGDGHILLHYTAVEVNLVMEAPRGAAVYLMQDTEPLRPQDAGGDVHFAGEHAIAQVREPRMYRLIKNQEFGSHLLSLSTSDAGLQAYAFSFSSCASDVCRQ
ncbi:MAG: redoxin domain-containing protein [Acidobacteria bacterium]|nr:redoxin domain-containing protein [Acidobacteriota bacterium]